MNINGDSNNSVINSPPAQNKNTNENILDTVIIDDLERSNELNNELDDLERLKSDKFNDEINNDLERSNELKDEMNNLNTSKDKNVNIFLANLISIFHTIVVLFVLIAPFTNIPSLLILHITFSISLLVHWWFNNDECSLTYIESKLRGLDRTEGFTYKFIAPMYNISKTEWSRLCYIVTIILLCVSIYYLYKSERVSRAFECYKKITSDQEYLIKPFYEKIPIIFECFKDLLIWR
jgi:hypothetical protein